MFGLFECTRSVGHVPNVPRARKASTRRHPQLKSTPKNSTAIMMDSTAAGAT